MGCSPKISTGISAGINTSSMAGGSPKSTWEILFNPLKSPIDDAFSPPVVISPGKGIFAVVYGLGEGEEVYTNITTVGSGRIGEHDPCTFGVVGPISIRGQLIDISRVTLGDPDEWIFRNDPEGKGIKVQMVINMPGRYQFELQNSMMASTIYMEYCFFDLEKIPTLPWPYLGGIAK